VAYTVLWHWLPFQSFTFFFVVILHESLAGTYCMNLYSVIMSSYIAYSFMYIFNVLWDSGSISLNSTLRFMLLRIRYSLPRIFFLICNENSAFFYHCAYLVTLLFHLVAHLTSSVHEVVPFRSYLFICLTKYRYHPFT
jgi:hypothetical protein